MLSTGFAFVRPPHLAGETWGFANARSGYSFGPPNQGTLGSTPQATYWRGRGFSRILVNAGPHAKLVLAENCHRLHCFR